VRRRPALDELTTGVSLVRAGDVEAEFGHIVEVKDRNVERAEPRGAGRGAGDRASQAGLPGSELVDQGVDGGAGADAEQHPLAQIFQCRGGGALFLLLSGKCHVFQPLK
jgi:hypothetical protein